MLNSRVVNAGSGTGILGGMKLPGGSQAAPFVYFNSNTTFAELKDSARSGSGGRSRRAASWS